MKALVADGSGGAELVDVADPVPGPNEVLLAVHAFSLNRGETQFLGTMARGWRPGYDCSGTVITAAADGGPPAGSRVLAYVGGGSWSELAKVPIVQVAVLPDEVGFEAGTALPTAGLTALRALAYSDLLLGSRVLITGAAGGVGRIAVQLARLGGADVTAIVGSEDRAKALAGLGNVEVVVGETAPGRYDLVLESAGGRSLTHALDVVAPGGVVVCIGRSSGESATVDTNWIGGHIGARVVAMVVTDELARRRCGVRDLSLLACLVARGHLDPGVSRVADWMSANDLVRDLVDRKIAGKAVCTVR